MCVILLISATTLGAAEIQAQEPAPSLFVPVANAEVSIASSMVEVPREVEIKVRRTASGEHMLLVSKLCCSTAGDVLHKLQQRMQHCCKAHRRSNALIGQQLFHK
jgi:hypothetical protein